MKKNELKTDEKKGKKVFIFINVIIAILLFFSITLTFSIDWAFKTFGELTIDAVIFELLAPMDGVNMQPVYNYLLYVLPKILIVTIFVLCIIIFPIRYINIKRERSKILNTIIKIKASYITKVILTLVIFIVSLKYNGKKINLAEYIKNYTESSNLIENEYVNPNNVKIEFPEKKRNLIYIYLESMESTYYSQKNGGAMKKSLIPEIEKMAVDNIAFSTGDEYQGSYSLHGTSWTVAAMTAQTLGLPLKVTLDRNTYGIGREFLPGAKSIGEILKEQGYNQMIMVGSDLNFGGRYNLFHGHGNYEVWDLNTAIEQGRMKEEDSVWWGYSDNDLIKYAKEQIIELSKKDEPFNFTMLTVDTHFTDGYLCPDCGSKFNKQYENVIACSSKKVAEFVKWIQKQEFYENTTIVISGDHLTMQTGDFDEIEEAGYKRTVLDIFINSAVEPAYTKNRGNSTFDMFPTTLASLGVEIEGNRLGLGTNLFSEEETIVQKYGIEYINDELEKKSVYYEKNFLYKK